MGGKKKGKKNHQDKKKAEFSWIGFLHTFRYIWPYVWPSGKPVLQLRFLASFSIIGLNRGLNVLIPIFYKDIVDNLVPQYNITPEVSIVNLTDTSTTTYNQATAHVPSYQPLNYFRWDIILIFVALKALSGGGGYLNCIRGLLWIQVIQNAQKKLRLDMFSKIHSLSIKWHQENKRTGAVVTLIDRGVVSMNLIIRAIAGIFLIEDGRKPKYSGETHIDSNLIFNVLPTLADIVIAFVFFVTVLNIWTGCIVFASIVGYLAATIILGEWRTKFKKGMTKADNERSAVFVDSILNHETVKSFTGEATELRRYEEKIDDLQEWDYKSDSSSKMIMAIQKTMMVFGLLGVSLLAAWYVWTGKFTVGDFVLFASYVEQLYSPLTMFSACYRILQDASLSMQHMMTVSGLQPEIKDGPAELNVSKGEICFKDVYFKHEPSVTPLLKNINFTIPPGKTYGIVGNSGGGKSTILKLLMRFYDVTMGKITIDGVNISEVSQKSLRQNLGILPQNATLFNQDISYNIQYSRTSADQSEVEQAATEAQIHHKITSLPQGYQTKVGENGVKLSGGEKRRVVIARAMIEGAQIILLDEATTGLDNKTEKDVWMALEHLCSSKTTIIVSHQLSHITHADRILVLKDGEIVEEGTHAELRAMNQYYEELWLLEHPEDITEFQFGPSFGCTVPDCSCSCHTENQEDKSTTLHNRCSSFECYCNCHDLEVEENVLAILKQESEEGMFEDLDHVPPSPKSSSNEEGKPSTATSGEIRSRSRAESDKELLLETIHEVPSTEERDEVFYSPVRVDIDVTEETDPLMPPPVTPRPKLGKITQQFSFDIGDEKTPPFWERAKSIDKEPNATKSSHSRKRMEFSKNKSLSLNDEDDIKLIISGKSFNLKSKRAIVESIFSDRNMLDRSMPECKLASLSRKSGNCALPLIRSKTVDVTTSPLSPNRTFQDIQKQRIKKQEKLDRAKEKERHRAISMIDDASSVVSLLPEDLAMMDSMPDYYEEGALHPLCSSINIPSGPEAFKKQLINCHSSSDKETSIEMPNV